MKRSPWLQSGRIAVAAMATISLLTAGEPARAQSPPSTLPELVARAEAQGAVFPRNDEMPKLIPRGFLDAGKFISADRKCVEASESPVNPRAQIARSGEFQIGGNLGVESYAVNKGMKVWWLPLHGRSEMHLVVTGRLVGSPTDTMRFESDNVAWPSSPGAPRKPEAEREYFFPSGMGDSFPKPGVWVVTASQQSDWGCFIFRLNP